VGPPAQAYLTSAEYFSATEPAHLMMTSADNWDSEAASDFVVYQRPLEWDGLWLRGKKVFDLSVGSISSKQFLTYNRLKLHHMLSEKLEFRLHWLEARDFEQDRVALPIELRYHFTEQFAFAVFGQPSLYKSEDDVGITASFRPDADCEVEASVLWGDFQRNKRNLNADEWSKSPVAYTLKATHLREGSATDFNTWQMHYEPHNVRSLNGIPTQTLGYQMISLSGLRSFGLASSWGYRLQGDKATSENHSAGEIRLRKRILSQFEYSWFANANRLRPGLTFFYRENHLNTGSDVVREVLPTFWFEFPERVKTWGHHAWSLGYDGTVFHRDSTLQSDQRAIQHRSNVKSSMKFSKAGELALLFTFDIDRLGSGETWEGGAAQFRTEF